MLMQLVGIVTLALFHLTPLYLIYKPSRRLIAWAARRWPDVLWRVDTDERIVALTLDDGPSQYTDEILDILQAYNAKATFFIIGSYVPGREGTLRRLVDAGHELANHAMHDEPSRSLPIDTLSKQITDVQQMITETCNAAKAEQPPKLFRPGHAWLSTPMRALLAKLGYTIVLGDVFPFDPQIPFASVNAAHVLGLTRPGSIIVCHDGRPWTAPMLRTVLPELNKRGYKFVTVSAAMGHRSSATTQAMQ